MGWMRSAQSAKSAAAGEVSQRRDERSAAAAEAAAWSAAAAAIDSPEARFSFEESAAAGMAPKEKAAEHAALWKSGSCVVGRTRDSTLMAARCKWSSVEVPASAARVHQTKRMPLRSMCWRCE
eukprot:2882463-Pleurochrysis_carterae.AAC.1